MVNFKATLPGAVCLDVVGTSFAIDRSSVKNPSDPKNQWTTSALARQIFGYWEQTPSACDSLVGIAQFWLPRQSVQSATKDIQVALDELVALGLVVKTSQPDGSVVYSKNGNLEHESP